MQRWLSKFYTHALTIIQPNRRRWMYPLLVLAIALAAYIRTLMPGTLGGDVGELQYAGPILALVHSTGQPVYTLLGKAWSELAVIGSVAYRMNLLAAVSVALGCAVLTWMQIKLHGNIIAGAAGGLMLAFGATVWTQAVIADKYGFNILISTVIIGLALWWDRDFEKPHADRVLYALCLAFSVALLHHRGLFLFAVGLGLLVFIRLNLGLIVNLRRTLICAALVLLPPLLIYPTVLPLLKANGNSPITWQPDTPAGWIDWLSERHVIEEMVLVFDDAASINAQLAIYRDTLLHDYTYIALLGAVLGWLVLLRRQPRSALFIAVTFALTGFFSANFRGNTRQFTYYLPTFPLLIYCYGYLIAALWDGLTHFFRTAAPPDEPERFARPLIIVGAIGSLAVFSLPAYQFWQSYPDRRAEQRIGEPLDIWRQELKTGNMGERLAAALDELPPEAVIVTDWEQVTVLWYYQQVEGRRPDLEILYPIERYTDYDNSPRPVCLGRHLSVGENWHPTNIGALVCLNREPNFTAPDNIAPLNITLATAENQPQLELTGYRMPASPLAAGQHVPLILTWRALTDLDADYSISVRLLTENWEIISARDIQAPVIGMYPTSRWVENEIVSDYHELTLPREMPPGRYLWAVVVYRALPDGGFETLLDPSGGQMTGGVSFEVIPG